MNIVDKNFKKIMNYSKLSSANSLFTDIRISLYIYKYSKKKEKKNED